MCLAIGAAAEILHLKDGTALEGTVKRTPDGYDVTDAAGTVTHVDPDNVIGIALTTRPVGAAEAESRLMSLRRSVENVVDINSVIDQYNRFIEQNKQSPAGKVAEGDLAAWVARRDKGMVKVGPNWVTADEKQKLQGELADVVSRASQALSRGNLRDADTEVQRALDVDPAFPAAAYLRGILLYRQDQLQPARKSFDTVAAAIKDHAPTLNNIAVILWRQNQQMGALNFYIQAMTAAPATRQVLDNVAEALNALSSNQKQNALVQKAVKIFMQQDADLQQQMAATGWFRWGSTWVPKAQYEKLQAIEKDIKARLDDLSTSYDEMKKKVDRIDADIDDNLRRMRTIEQTSYATDSQGNIIHLPLPQRYYDLDRENHQLAQDRADDVSKLDGMRTTAKKIQQQLPTPKFTQIQKMVGAEGMPGQAGRSAAAPVIPSVPADSPPAMKMPSTVPARGATTQRASRPKVPDSLLSPG